MALIEQTEKVALKIFGKRLNSNTSKFVYACFSTVST